MLTLKKTARCPRCGRPVITTGRSWDEKRGTYTYIHNDLRQHDHFEVIWIKDRKHYEVGVYNRLYRETERKVKKSAKQR